MIDEEFFKTASNQEQLVIRRSMRSKQKETEEVYKQFLSLINQETF